MAAATHRRVPEVRLDQPRAARRLGLPPEHRRGAAADEPPDVSAHVAGARRSHAPVEQMIRRAMLRALLCIALALTLGGCASMPFFGSRDTKAVGAAAEPQVALYQFEVVAPEPLD